jgi:hypothetical protein
MSPKECSAFPSLRQTTTIAVIILTEMFAETQNNLITLRVLTLKTEVTEKNIAAKTKGQGQRQ